MVWFSTWFFCTASTLLILFWYCAGEEMAKTIELVEEVCEGIIQIWKKPFTDKIFLCLFGVLVVLISIAIYNIRQEI